ncbi:glucose 1-dehydrogenase [Pleurocapsa sp. PCC 7319]|uniref:glucose 1-dehydrogenase n=1 Tax=Pleurocapsa sp. PCC 7319 TaxID=118161 RepID=UPI0003454ACE|nr:glucose 1-dehydrogenase [Pleurocapsa sp. PCC 7319]
MKGLKGKNVLVTGATSGIGQAIAAYFAQEGANVALNYRNDPDKLDDTKELIDQMCNQVKGCGGKELPVEGDVSKEADIIRMCNEVIEKLGSLDILINNAGIQTAAPSHELETSDFDKVIEVNLRGAYLCARETIKHFINRGHSGIIINVSSVHEIIPRPNYVSYSMSKGAMENMTKTLALEYAPHGIRINAIAPGATATPINSWTDNPQKRKEVESHIPMGRAGTPEEMAAITAFLASDDAAYITGQTLFVDGGLTLYPDFLKPWSAGE